MFRCLLMCVTYISQIPLCLCLFVCVCVWVVCVQKASVHSTSVYACVFTENVCGQSNCRSFLFTFFFFLDFCVFWGFQANLHFIFHVFLFLFICLFMLTFIFTVVL